DAFANGHQPARARAFVLGELGDLPQARIAKEDLDSVRAESLFVLADDAAFGIFQDRKKIFHAERLANDAHRQTANEFRLETEIDEVTRLHQVQRFIFGDIAIARRETNRRLAQTFADDFFQSIERAADD